MNRIEILDEIGHQLWDQINYIDNEIMGLVSDLSNETKSSAGDKFETAREMIQQERVKLEQSKSQKSMMLSALNQLKDKTVTPTANSGSIISTGNGVFILGLAVGKIQLKNDSVIFGLGLNSPIAREFMHKSPGDSFELNGMIYKIDLVC